MITVFNRKELLVTLDMKRQADICEVLSSKGIDYAVKTTIFKVQLQLECKGRVRGNYGIDQKYSYEYKIYVRKEDFDRASSLIR